MLFRGEKHTGSRADEMGGEYVSGAAPVIVGGSGRSGTTLMRVMLDTHSRICAGPESWLFTPKEIDVSLLTRNFDLPEAQVKSIADKADSRAEFIDRFFSAYCSSTGKPRWAEKTPANIEHLEFIFRTFPNSRFIEMVRDGRDVSCSMRTHPRYKIVGGKLVPLNNWNPLNQCIERWMNAIEVSRPNWADTRYLQVRYENLVLRPEETLKTVFAFIHEPYEEAVVHYHEVTSNSRKIEKFPQNREATQPVSENAIGRWKRDLGPEDRQLFKEMAGDLLIDFGFEASHDW